MFTHLGAAEIASDIEHAEKQELLKEEVKELAALPEAEAPADN